MSGADCGGIEQFISYFLQYEIHVQLNLVITDTKGTGKSVRYHYYDK